jgi:hypothetical protein
VTGWNLAALLFAAAWGGGYLALLGRALVEERTERRLTDAAKRALDPEQMERLQAYLNIVSEDEEERYLSLLPPGRS